MRPGRGKNAEFMRIQGEKHAKTVAIDSAEALCYSQPAPESIE